MNRPPSPPSNPMEPDPQAGLEVETWVERARQGDKDAFGRLVHHFHHRLFGLLVQMVGNAADAEELEQQVWIKAWKRLRSFRGQSAFYTWLYRIGTFTAVDFLRRRKRRPESEWDPAIAYPEHHDVETAPSVASRPDREAERDDIQRRFHEVLETLSPTHRTALWMREVDSMSYEEIAAATGCRVGTVMSRLYYARQAVQEQMKDLL